jgi:uncharacterized RDD family membrane protein YckC
VTAGAAAEVRGEPRFPEVPHAYRPSGKTTTRAVLGLLLGAVIIGVIAGLFGRFLVPFGARLPLLIALVYFSFVGFVGGLGMAIVMRMISEITHNRNTGIAVTAGVLAGLLAVLMVASGGPSVLGWIIFSLCALGYPALMPTIGRSPYCEVHRRHMSSHTRYFARQREVEAMAILGRGDFAALSFAGLERPNPLEEGELVYESCSECKAGFLTLSIAWVESRRRRDGTSDNNYHRRCVYSIPTAAHDAPVLAAVMTVPAPGGPSEVPDGEEKTPAGRFRRLGAALVDNLLALSVLFVAGVIGAALSAAAGARTVADQSPWMIGVGAVAVLALASFQSFRLATTGQTIAKKWFGLKIVKVDGLRPGFGSAVLMRGVLPGAVSLVPYLGWLFWLVDVLFILRGDRRCLHDRMAGTKVVRAQRGLA